MCSTATGPRRSSMKSMRLPLALLLVCASMSAHLASAVTSGGFLFSSTETAEVPVSARVSSDQVYARTWQVHANGMASATAVEELRMLPEGIVFVSYVEDGSSDALADVKISGKAYTQVNNIIVQNDIRAAGSSILVQTDVSRPYTANDIGPLLIETLLHKKRGLKRVQVASKGDVVIEDNVLFTTTKEAVAAFPVPTSTIGAALKIEASRVLPGGNNWDVMAIANVSNTSAVTLGLQSLYADGPVNITLYCSLSSSDARSGSIARVTTESYNGEVKLSYAKSELSVTHGGDYDTLAVQVDTSSTITKIGRVQITLLTLPSVQVQLPNLAANVEVTDVCLRKPDRDAGLMLDFRSMVGSVYIVDKDAALFATEAFFQGPMDNMQIEVKELTTTALALRSSTPESTIHYFSTGATTSLLITAAPNRAKICASSSNNLKVAFVDPRASPLVSYPGRAGGNTFECKKRVIPKRVPSAASGWPTMEENGTAPKPSPASRTSASSVTHVALLVMGLIVAAVM